VRLGPPNRSLQARLHPSDSESRPRPSISPCLTYATFPNASSTERTYRIGCERTRIEYPDTEVTVPDSDLAYAAALNVDPDTERITTSWITALPHIDPAGPPMPLKVPDAYPKPHSC